MKTERNKEDDSLKILIVDQNKVYASFVKEILHNYMTANIDIAVNVFELRRKLAEKKYTLIIADLAVTEDEDEISAELSKAGSTVIAWTSVSKKCRTSCLAEVRKPSNLDEMKRLIPTMMTNHL